MLVVIFFPSMLKLFRYIHFDAKRNYVLDAKNHFSKRPWIPERLLYTRPDKIESKFGTSGQPITCEANYFRLLTKPDWQLFAYRVDFKPDVEDRRFRNFLVGSQRQMIGGYLFDGTQLFCSQRLEADLVEKTVTGRTGEAILVTFKYTRSVSMTEEQSQLILNLILRRCMAGLEMQLIGRNYFDKDAKVTMHRVKSQQTSSL